MGFMDAIAGGLAGAGAAMEDIGTQRVKQIGELDLTRVRAEIEAARDARINEYNVGMEKNVRQPFQRGEREATQGFQRTMETEVRQPFMSKEREAGQEFRTGEREAEQKFRAGESAEDRKLRSRELDQQGTRISLESRKVKLLEDAGALDLKVKQSIDDARQAYVNETDPEKKQQAGATYLTLLGKVGERYRELSETDAAGNKVTTGFFDTLSGKEVKRQGGAGRNNGWDQTTGDVYRAGKVIGKAKSEKEARDMFGSTAVPGASAADAVKATSGPGWASDPANRQGAAPPSGTPSGAPSDAEFNSMLADAKRGGATGKNYLRQRLAEGGLSIKQRLEAKAATEE